MLCVLVGCVVDVDGEGWNCFCKFVELVVFDFVVNCVGDLCGFVFIGIW